MPSLVTHNTTHKYSNTTKRVREVCTINHNIFVHRLKWKDPALNALVLRKTYAFNALNLQHGVYIMIYNGSEEALILH